MPLYSFEPMLPLPGRSRNRSSYDRPVDDQRYDQRYDQLVVFALFPLCPHE